MVTKFIMKYTLRGNIFLRLTDIMMIYLDTIPFKSYYLFNKFYIKLKMIKFIFNHFKEIYINFLSFLMKFTKFSFFVGKLIE